jgi:hypothetical protein
MAVFFASYARLDDTRFSKLSDAIDELRERVRGKLGLPSVEDAGFYDQREIQVGAPWAGELLTAIATCRVFVCFCSNTYFNREICGKEFETFRRRLRAEPHAAARIVPILWDTCSVPQALLEYQMNHRNLPSEYFEDGLCALRRLRKNAEYEMALEVLADAIAQAAAEAPLQPAAVNVDQFAAMPSAFDNPRPDAIGVGALHDLGLRWLVDGVRTLRSIAEDAAATERVGWRELWDRHDITKPLGVRGHNDSGIIVAPPDEDLSEPSRQALREVRKAIARPGSPLTALLIGAGRTPAGPAPSADGGLLGGTFAAGSAVGLTDALRCAIGEVRMASAKGQDAARVVSGEIESTAAETGVPIATAPVVSAVRS